MILSDIPPGLLLIVCALLVPLFKGHLKSAFMIVVPALAFYGIWSLSAEASFQLSFLGYELNLLRVDKFSKAFGYIFTLNAFAAYIYAYYVKDDVQHVSSLMYIGSALGVVFAADLISLYLFWEIMAITSTFLILARRTEKAMGAAQRYILVHILGGLILLAGIILTVAETGSIAFNGFDFETQESLGTWLILSGFLVNAAAPPLSAWLSDGYPEATVTGGIILSAYTSKTAVYTLLRGFPEWRILILIGCLMALYGIIYALLENDMRRILAYSIINQVGFMVCAVGIGTEMALNGAVAHAFCHIIYKALLWMSAGAVLYQTGKSKCTDLGGLYKTMPWTLIFGTIGALAISAVPLTSGFTSKSLIISGAAEAHYFWAWFILEVASAGVFLHAGIKFPYFVFFAKDRGLRPQEAPVSMRIAMGLMAFLCIFLGCYPDPLYAILPFEVHYHTYTAEHVMTQMQLLMFSALVFFLFLPLLKRTDTIALDTDWFYRKGAKTFYRAMDKNLNGLNAWAHRVFILGLTAKINYFFTAGPARIVLAWSIPFLAYRRLNREEKAEIRNRLYHNAHFGAFPVGITAFFAVMFLAILFIQSF